MFYSKIDKDNKVIKSIIAEKFNEAESILNPDYVNGENILVTFYKDGHEITHLCTENWKQIEKIKNNALQLIEQIESKVVKTAHKSYNKMAIAFTDDTYIAFKIECDDDLTLLIVKNDVYDLFQLGFITEEQYRTYVKEEEERQKDILYKKELAELERLTKKYNR